MREGGEDGNGSGIIAVARRRHGEDDHSGRLADGAIKVDGGPEMMSGQYPMVPWSSPFGNGSGERRSGSGTDRASDSRRETRPRVEAGGPEGSGGSDAESPFGFNPVMRRTSV